MTEALVLIRCRIALGTAIARGESEPAGTIGTGYNILVGGERFESFAGFPQWPGRRYSTGISHAAGRYQFQPATWRGCMASLELPDFSPAAQDAAFWFLAQQVYRRHTGDSLGPALIAGDLSHLEAALKSTWTSVNSKIVSRFRAALGG